MTILPSCRTTAGLNVPADSQPLPCGESMGVSEARRHDPNGSFQSAAASRQPRPRVKSREDVRVLRAMWIRQFMRCELYLQRCDANCISRDRLCHKSSVALNECSEGISLLLSCLVLPPLDRLTSASWLFQCFQQFLGLSHQCP